jgi:Fe-S cluster biogenesis protein NfuA
VTAAVSRDDLLAEVTAVMDDVGRRVESHGGTMRWELDDEGVVTVQLEGACKGCHALPVTYVGAVRTRLLEQTRVADVRLRGPVMSRFAMERIATMFGSGTAVPR